jgi:hypothetical protein
MKESNICSRERETASNAVDRARSPIEQVMSQSKTFGNAALAALRRFHSERDLSF